MSYIGIQPAEKFTSFATQTFSVSATTSYTLDHAVANENELALFVNNVRQQPGSGKAYTATSTTLTLSAATATTDTMYCIYLGRALQTVTPATNSITSSMVTSSFPLGITEADQWRLTASITSSTDPISSNLERVDDATFSKIGTGMSVSSGHWTFPSTGLYQVFGNANIGTGATDNVYLTIEASTDSGSSYDRLVQFQQSDSVATYGGHAGGQVFVNVTNASTFRIKFTADSLATNAEVNGNTDYNFTYFTFIRLGDSQ